MMTKINALIIAIYLFFAGFIYGDEPVKVEFDCEFSRTEFSCPEEFGFTLTIKGKNVGRPFEGDKPYYVDVSVYRVVNGEKRYLRWEGTWDDGLSRRVLIKHGEELEFITKPGSWYAVGYDFTSGDPTRGIEPGIYSVEVRVYGCEKVYENILMIRNGEEV